MISSKNNAKIKYVKKLLSSAKERRLKSLFVVEGARIVKEAPAEWVQQLFISESFAPSGMFALDQYEDVEIVSDEVFRILSDTVTPQGVLAVVRQPKYALDLSQYKEKCCLILLDGVQDPGNLGTIVRTAEAAGADMVIMNRGCADLYNPKVIRSTMGSIFRVPCLTDDLVPVIEILKAEGIAVYGAALEEAVSFREISFSDRMALVIGNEGNGISEGILNSVNERVYIPMQGQVESLNAAVSAAVLLYHMNH